MMIPPVESVAPDPGRAIPWDKDAGLARKGRRLTEKARVRGTMNKLMGPQPRCVEIRGIVIQEWVRRVPTSHKRRRDPLRRPSPDSKISTDPVTSGSPKVVKGITNHIVRRATIITYHPRSRSPVKIKQVQLTRGDKVRIRIRRRGI